MQEMTIRRFPALDYQAKEAFNTLCANLSFLGKDVKKILLTSCRPMEGKSSVCMELMRTFAGIGKRVVLVDSDIRASALQGRYDIQVNLPDVEQYQGLTSYLAGYCDMDEIIGVTNIGGAHMILAGRNVTNSLPLLSSDRLDQLMEELKRRFDVVLVDTPPVGTIIDAAKVARCCDGTLFVVKSGEVSKKELFDAMRQMENAGSQILGTVLNQYDDKAYGGSYYHKTDYYRYGSLDKGRPGGSLKKKKRLKSKAFR